MLCGSHPSVAQQDIFDRTTAHAIHIRDGLVRQPAAVRATIALVKSAYSCHVARPQCVFPVAILRFVRGPAHVTGTVVGVIVNPVNRPPLAQVWSYVRSKRRIHVPLRTHPYAPPRVRWIVMVPRRPVTAPMH